MSILKCHSSFPKLPLFFSWKQFVIRGTFNREHIIFLQGYGACHSLPTVPINRIGPFSGVFDTFQSRKELSYRKRPIKAAMKTLDKYC